MDIHDEDTQVKAAIHTASVAAAGVSASPIPFSDSALLEPIQITMIASIYKIRGERISEGVLKGAVKASFATGLGKGIIGNVIKMVPGIGSILGGVINGTTSVAITETIGFAVDRALTSGEEDVSDELMDIITQAIKDGLKKK